MDIDSLYCHYLVNHYAMVQSIQLLRQGIEDSKMGKKQSLKALERLGPFIKHLGESGDLSG